MRRTRRCPHVNPELLVIGVDIAKTDHVAVGLSGDGSETRPLRFASDRTGFEKLAAAASEWVKRHGAKGFVVALEPTGHYGTTLVTWLAMQGVEVFSVLPSHTNRAKDLYDGTSRKTDPKDAAVIAGLCRQGVARPYRLPTGPFATLRVASHQREQVVKRKSQIVNRLHRHVDVVFPELRTVFRKIESRTSQWVLRTTPTPADVLRMPLEDLATALHKVSRGQLGRKRAEALHAVAKKSVGILEGREAHRTAITQLVTELGGVAEQLRVVERQMEASLAEIPYAAQLLTIPMLGKITTATLLGEFGDLKNYKVSRQLIAMAGLDLVERSSGQHQGHHHVSRRGRAYARQMLYLAALRTGWGVLAETRRRKVEDRNDVPAKAAVANMARLLRILHALARDGVAFDPTRLPARPAAAA